MPMIAVQNKIFLQQRRKQQRWTAGRDEQDQGRAGHQCDSFKIREQRPLPQSAALRTAAAGA